MSKRNVPAPLRIEVVKATRAETDEKYEELLNRWAVGAVGSVGTTPDGMD